MQGKNSILSAVAQGLAVDERHHIIQETVRLTRIEQRQDVGMLEIGCGPDFLHEPLGSEHGREFGPQHLHHHLAVVFQVLGEVDRGHAARTKFFLDGVLVREDSLETV